MMNPEIKRRWVAALRSGKYPQGEPGYLKTPPFQGREGYCCLGVLQELIEPKGMGGLNGFLALPTASCLRKAGLPKYRRNRFSREMDAPDNGIIMKLVDMNDDKRASFKEIANFIEQNL